jgi:HEAT repeat protein
MPRAPTEWRAIIRRARRLSSRRDPQALDLLFSALRWRYDTARDEAVRLLASYRPPPTPRLLRTLSGAETAVERRAAAEALGLMRSRRAVPSLLRALRDPSMSVRRSASRALLRVGAREAVPRIARLLRDESGGVRVLAAGVLGRFGDPRAVPGLLRALKDEKWYVRQAAARALGELRDPRGSSPLRRATMDPRPAVAREARRALKARAPETGAA